ncbi:MAG TPA: hypothetical protein ENN33_05915 [Ignavibacteria bacterium]|nr:hypothetical protein [Ignavibacteria bacterium]
MLHYIIDGNNLIGKQSSLKSLQKSDPQQSREKLAFILDRFFTNKKVNVTLHFDGFEKDKIRTAKLKIVYSDNKTADEKIRQQIEYSKNPKKLVVVTSDFPLSEFAKKCSCAVIKSEEFLKKLSDKSDSKSENEIQKEIDNEEIKKLFGI